MSHVATAPHECEGNLIFTEHGLSPYWAISRLLFDRFDGDSREIGAEIVGEAWTIELDDQKVLLRDRSLVRDRINRFASSDESWGSAVPAQREIPLRECA